MSRATRLGESLVAGALLASSVARARRLEVGPTEEAVFRRFNDCHDGFHVPVWPIMQSGTFGAVFVAGAVTHRRFGAREAAMVTAVGTAVWGGVKALKPLVGRGRPAAHLPDVSVRGAAQSGLGFPSGHAAVATTLALTTATTWPGRVAGLAVAAVTGGGRMYVGAHLPLDVVAGFAIGAIAGIAARAVQ